MTTFLYIKQDGGRLFIRNNDWHATRAEPESVFDTRTNGFLWRLSQLIVAMCVCLRVRVRVWVFAYLDMLACMYGVFKL